MAIKDQFYRPDEKLIAKIGGGYALNVLTIGRFQSVGASLTDKRVYFQGKVYERVGGRFIRVKRSAVVCVDDVTGTGFVHLGHIWLLITAALALLAGFYATIMDPLYLLLVGFLPATILFVIYLVSRDTLFEIRFAGGGIAFKVGLISVKEAEDFQRNLHLVKDYYKSASREGLSESIAASAVNAGIGMPSAVGGSPTADTNKETTGSAIGGMSKISGEVSKASSKVGQLASDTVASVAMKTGASTPKASAEAAARKTTSGAHCKSCGAELAPSDAFCQKCGAKVE